MKSDDSLALFEEQQQDILLLRGQYRFVKDLVA